MSVYENLISRAISPQEKNPNLLLGEADIVPEWKLNRAICPAL